jgi:uncharacterized membrane protein
MTTRFCGLRRLAADRRANFATATALTMPVLLVMSGLVVDEASLFFQRRQAQGLADLAAITAAANIDRAAFAAETVLTDNGVRHVTVIDPDDAAVVQGALTPDAVAISVIGGRYEADPAVATRQRFTAGATPPNAVKVTMRQQGLRHFAAAVIGTPTIVTTAIASAPAEAAFSIGSRLASLDGGLLNAILGGLTGSTLSLKVMDYRALVDANVKLFGFLDALASRLHITAATYSDVLDAEANIGDIAAALAATDGVGPEARAALLAIVAGSSSGARLSLAKLVDLGETGRLALGQRPAGLAADVGVMEMLGAAATVAGGGRQVAIDLGASLPGLAAATLDVAIGEPPQASPRLSIGGVGKVVRTAQTRLLLTVTLGGPGGLLGTSVSLPVYLELARGEATLKAVNCPTGRIDSLRDDVAARPGVADLRIGAVDKSRFADFGRSPMGGPARIVAAPLVTVNAAAHAEIANVETQTLTFRHRDVSEHAAKTVSTRNLTRSLTASLLADIQLDVKVAGLGLAPPSVLKGSLANLLAAATPSLDTLLDGVLAALGVRVGEADVRVNGATCGRSVLVQ